MVLNFFNDFVVLPFVNYIGDYLYIQSCIDPYFVKIQMNSVSTKINEVDTSFKVRIHKTQHRSMRVLREKNQRRQGKANFIMRQTQQ